MSDNPSKKFDKYVSGSFVGMYIAINKQGVPSGHSFIVYSIRMGRQGGFLLSSRVGGDTKITRRWLPNESRALQAMRKIAPLTQWRKRRNLRQHSV